MWKDKGEIKDLMPEWKPNIPENIEIADCTLKYFVCEFIDWLYDKKKYRVVNTHQQPHDVDKYYEE